MYKYWMLLSVLGFLSCKFIERRPVKAPEGFDWQGHRGARGLLPENTIPAFLKALEFPEITTLELDLAVSKDHFLIVSHEPWFNPQICRTATGDTIGKSNLYTLTAAEIRQYDCGSVGNSRFPDQQKMKTHKPSLSELVERIKSVNPTKAATIRYNIEIKSNPDWDNIYHPDIETYVKLVIAELKALNLIQQCNVQSFDPRALQIMHRLAPEIKLAYLVENGETVDKHLQTLGFIPPLYSPYYMTINKKTVLTAHQKGMKVVPWTVNDVYAMRRLIRMGVDGIITDYPNYIEQAVKPK